MRRYRWGWLRGYVQPHRALWPAAFASSSAVAVWKFFIIFESFLGSLDPASLGSRYSTVGSGVQTWGFAERAQSILLG